MYCDTLEQYLYYLDHDAPAVRLSSLGNVDLLTSIQVAPKFVNSLVELITSNIDNITSPDVHPSQRAPPGLIEGVQTPDMIIRHFRNILIYIQGRKTSTTDGPWAEVDVIGAVLKMGLAR